MKRVLFLSAIYAAFALCACFGVAFVRQIPELLPSDEALFRILSAVRYFLKLLPSLCITGALIGSTIEFRKFSPRCRERFSDDILYLFGIVIKTSLIFVLLSTVASEIFLPAVTTKRASLRSNYLLYRDYLKWGEHYLNEGELELALHYAQGIAAIDSKSAESQTFISRAETAYDVSEHRKNFEFGTSEKPQTEPQTEVVFISLDFLQTKARAFADQGDSFAAQYYEKLVAEMQTAQTKSISLEELKAKAKEEASKGDGFALHYYSELAKEFNQKENTSLSFEQLKAKAKEAERKGDWFAAHYYARLAERMDGSDEGGAKAWKQLSIPQKSINYEQYEAIYDVYSTKYYGYSALVNDDPITAYYTFKTLYDTSRELADDPDIQKYLAQSEKALLQKYFFVDEMNGIEPFESVRNMFFSVKTDDGTFVVFVQGVANFAGGKYLRGLSVHKFNTAGEAEYSMVVPFAKLFSSDGDEINIMVKSVYKENDAGIIEPIFTTPDGLSTMRESLVFTLPIPYRDFNLVAESSVGADKMFLPQLMQFVRKSVQYGFSTESHRLILVERLCYPLLLLIIFVFCAAVGWNYRVDNGFSFRIRWIFVFPFLTAILYIALSIGLYALKLLAALIVGLVGFYALPVCLVACICMLTIASFLFLSRKAD